jgi:hypothetical protein
MNTGLRSVVLGFFLAALAVVPAYSQQKDDANQDSLGNIARKLSAEKAKDPKPVKVFTNDNLYVSEGDISVLNAGPKEAKAPVSSPEKQGAKTPAHDEAYYHGQLSTLKERLETHQRELEVLQQKLGQNNMQYYDDPNKSLQQQYSREDIDKLKSEIDAKQRVVDADNKAIDDLRDQLRHEGGDPGWLR